MGDRTCISKYLASLAAAIALFVACACALLPATAEAAGLKGGVVLKSLSGPTITYVVSPSPGAGKVTISASVSDADGHEYQAALNKSFTKGVKKKLSSKTAVRFTTLKKGAKYYVRVRSYAKLGGKLYVTPWSKVKAVRASIARSKAKFLGSWKLIKSSNASDNRIIQNNRKYYPNVHHIMKFNKNGYVSEKGYLGKRSKAKWAAKSKTVGYFVVKDVRSGSIRVVNGKLVVKAGSTTMTFARL